MVCRETKLLLKVAVEVEPRLQHYFTSHLEFSDLCVFFYFELFPVLKHAMIECSNAFITGGVDKNSTTNLPHHYISQNSDKIS